LPLIVTANAVVGKPWANHATGILAGLTSGATFLLGAVYYAGLLGLPAPGASNAGIGVGIMITAVAAAVLAFDPVRKRVAGVLHMDADNPVHTLALVLAVILFGSQISLVTFSDVLAADRSQPPLTVLDLFAQEVPFLIIAVTGVGLYIRRQAAEAAVRLGVVRPAWWQVTLALAAGGAFFAFSLGVDSLSHTFTPGVAHNVDITTQHIFGGLGDPVGIAAIALLPAVCEEVLFRGALQPRLGLVVTALLFTSIHTQYSISFDTLAVFILAVGLGLIRKYTNTTTSSICHASYNLLVSFGITGAVLGFAVAAEVVLAAVTVFAIWSYRRRAAAASSSS
jgi:membrane protease YdiL (CAAX protease family)